MTDTVKEAARQIVSQMSADDIREIEIRGAEGWREGISMMLNAEWGQLDQGPDLVGVAPYLAVTELPEGAEELDWDLAQDLHETAERIERS